MIISVNFLLMMILIIMMKNSFPFNERVKTFLLCKLLTSLDYKQDLLTTLSTSYEDYQRLLLCKRVPFLEFCFREKYYHSHSKKNPQVKEKTLVKILNSGQNSQLKRKFSIQDKVLNLRENSQFRRKFST